MFKKQDDYQSNIWSNQALWQNPGSASEITNVFVTEPVTVTEQPPIDTTSVLHVIISETLLPL